VKYEPTWLKREILDEIHQDQLKQHGGLSGVRDENALESALARAKNRWSYQSGGDIFDLAAAYGFGLATSHPYSDGNKRIAFLAMYVFLGLNDFDLEVSQVQVVEVILQLASGSLDESELGSWLRQHSQPTPPD
jgi:death-on-curing protein